MISGLPSFGHNYYDAEGEVSQEPSPVGDVAHVAFQMLSAALLSGKPWEWAINTFNFASDVGPTGAIHFFNTIMRDRVEVDAEGRETVYYKPIFTADVAHKPGATMITTPELWRRCGGSGRKGEGTDGGRELGLLAALIGRCQPLGIDHSTYHSEMKTALLLNAFKDDHLRACAPAMHALARQFWRLFRSGDVVDASEATIQYFSRVNARAFIAPPGSPAWEMIQPKMFHPDGSLNEEWSKIPRAVERLGQEVSDAILLSPGWIARQLASPLTRRLQAWGWMKPTELQEQAQVLSEASKMLIGVSKAAAKKPGEAAVRGMIEFMHRPKEFKPDWKRESYTNEELESMTRLMLVVGQRTSSVAFEGLLMFMALYPEWQEKLYEEIKSLPDPIDFDTLHSLPLLHSVIWEDLRLTPPVPLQTRELIQDVTYEGTTYKAGTMLAYIHRQAQRNPDLFPNPEEFDPGRFKMDGAMNKAEYGPQRFSPENPPLHTFSMPPHQCCGRVHALTAMKLAIVSILKEARIEPADAEEMRQIFHIGGFVLRHSAPIRVRFIPR